MPLNSLPNPNDFSSSGEMKIAVPGPLAADHRWQGRDKTLVYQQRVSSSSISSFALASIFACLWQSRHFSLRVLPIVFIFLLVYKLSRR
jgi:hypothetical protein